MTLSDQIRIPVLVIAVMLVACTGMLFFTGCSAKKAPAKTPKLSLPHAMITNDIDASNPEKAFEKPITEISPTDSYVASVAEFSGLIGEHEFRWDWFDPAGQLYYTTNNFSINESGNKKPDGVAWHKIAVNGEPAESLPGKWRVQIFVDDALFQTSSFYVSKKIDADFSNVDVNIPRTAMKNPDAIAIVIGNKNYWHNDLPKVKYAIRDVETMAQYLNKTLGYLSKNIFEIKDAPVSVFNEYFGTHDNYKGKLYHYIKPGKSDVFIYYSGHGAPDVTTTSAKKKAYLVPVDCDPASISLNGYSLDLLYDNISKLPARHVTVVLDTCFSGGSGSGEMFIKGQSAFIIAQKPEVKKEKIVFLNSADENQVSSWYDEHQHGLFTYYFLKAIQGNADLNKDKQLTYKEIYDYVAEDGNVPYAARRLYHGRVQKPTIQGKNLNKVLIKY
jgi:hypothetical protein